MSKEGADNIMRTILTEMTVCGFKSITKPITINFTNKKIDIDTFEKPLVKAIYGTNGEGKSAIIHSPYVIYCFPDSGMKINL